MTDRPGLTVLQLTPDLEIGGAQETTLMLAKYLPRSGCRTVVATFADGPLRAEIASLGVPVEVLPGRRHGIVALPRFLAELVRLRRALVRLVTRYRVDVVLTKGLGTLDFLVMTLRVRPGSSASRPQVWWTIENSAFMVRREHLVRHAWLLAPKQVSHRLLYRLGARLVSGVIAVSDETARSFSETVGHVGDRVTVICNAVDAERYPAPIDREALRRQLGFGPNDHVMTMVGTFKRQKGHVHLLEAAASVAGQLADLHIVLVGGGELAEAIDARLAELGLDGRVHLLGSRRDVPELLAASDSFVLPSLWEGLPVALVEAMASRLPVIATAVSGTSQVMVPGLTGWVVPPADAGALARAMVELVSDPARAATMADAAANRSAAFSAAAQAEQLVALFRRGRPLPPGPAAAGGRSEGSMTGPIYIGGATRSGKTLMRWLLASHPRVAVSRRADMWPRFYARYGNLARPENLDGCLEAMLARPQVAVLVTDPQQIRREFARGSPTYGRLFALIQDQYAARCDKPRWGDQSGMIERFAEPVMMAYPDARILHLIRDPRDRHEAVAARAGPLRPGSAGRSAASWLRSARLARRNAGQWPDNYRVVRYETLVSRPEETMREVCAFLGENYEPEMLRVAATRRYDHERARDDGSPVSTAYVGHYRGRISRADLAFIQSVAGRPMDDFGYAREPMPRSLSGRARLALHWPVALADLEVERLRALANRSVVAG